jgi:hypothetical protein
MNYDKLDNDELLRLSLDAINNGRDADSVVMLKTLLERDPRHMYGQYLLAAQHAQLSMFDRAEAGFRTVVAQAPEFAIARFQLAQLLLMKGAADEARQLLTPVSAQQDALGAYARALSVADDDVATAIRELDAGIAMPQEIPALAADMQRVRDQLAQNLSQGGAANAVQSQPQAAPIFLTGYGREG